MVGQFKGLITREDVNQLTHSEGLIFDDDRIAILESMLSIDVQACPGSGKTTLIAAKLMLLAKKWSLSGQGICVLSHTNVAKDEIIERLKQSKTSEAQRLLSYPHFIGTIQEFTNRFLALPFIHSSGVDEVTVDNEEYVALASKILTKHQFSWLRGTLNGLGGDDMKAAFLRYTHRLTSDDVNIFKKPRSWSQPSNLDRAKQSLGVLKNYLDKRGYYLYRDMYSLAQKVCAQNESLCNSLSMRFPLVLIDEMQDTQRFQDDLLCQVFPLDNSDVIVQRFGDPDQAIFHGIGNEESNESFNCKRADDMNFVINKSHRFDGGLASKIKLLSVNQIQLSTEISGDRLVNRLNACSQEGGFQHSIIVFDDDTLGEVIKSFANIVSEQFQDEYKTSENFKVKAVGAVGNEIDSSQEQLKIGHYWSSYDKNKAKNSLKASNLIDIMRHVRQLSTLDFSENYKILIGGIIKWLSLSKQLDDNDRRFTPKSLQKFLQKQEKWTTLRENLYSLLVNDATLTQECWKEICVELKDIFELQDLTEVAEQYLSYSENSLHDEDTDGAYVGGMLSLPENKIRHPDGFDIHLSTIHGVKGETHDATLVMETKNHCFDLEAMLPYMTNNLPSHEHPHVDLPDKPHHNRRFKPNKLFSRQLYVAASRPRHLLCIAMHASRITVEQKQALTDLGWKIIALSQEGDFA